MFLEGGTPVVERDDSNSIIRIHHPDQIAENDIKIGFAEKDIKIARVSI